MGNSDHKQGLAFEHDLSFVINALDDYDASFVFWNVFRGYDSFKGDIEVKDAANQYLDRHPRSTCVMNTLAIVYLAERNYGKAEAMSRRCLKVDPKNYDAWRHVYEACIMTGRSSEAVAPAIKVLRYHTYKREKDPRKRERHAKDFESIARLMLHFDRSGFAKAAVEIALTYSPRPTGVSLLARTMFGQGLYQEAFEVTTRGLQEFSEDHPRLLLMHAVTAFRLGWSGPDSERDKSYDKTAEDCFRKAHVLAKKEVASNPNRRESVVLLFDILKRQVRFYRGTANLVAARVAHSNFLDLASSPGFMKSPGLREAAVAFDQDIAPTIGLAPRLGREYFQDRSHETCQPSSRFSGRPTVAQQHARQNHTRQRVAG